MAFGHSGLLGRNVRQPVETVRIEDNVNAFIRSNIPTGMIVAVYQLRMEFAI